MTFAYPWVLLFVLLLPILLWLRMRQSGPAITFSYVSRENLRLGLGWRRIILPVLQTAALAMLLVAAARPQKFLGERQKSSEGLDIVMVVDTSGSMRALDFTLNGKTVDRLTVVKSVLEKFVDERVDDRLGLVVFGQEAFTQAPLTLDHQVLKKFLSLIKIGMAGDATAIGNALAVAGKRIKDVEAPEKIVILLTDGRNTAGDIQPTDAAEALKQLGVKVYAVGVGAKGKIPIPVDTPLGQRLVYQESDLDEPLLEKIAAMTGGKYFRAYDTDSLRNIYATIDTLEKHKVTAPQFNRAEEFYRIFLTIGLGIMLLQIMLRLSNLRSIP